VGSPYPWEAMIRKAIGGNPMKVFLPNIFMKKPYKKP
jgi:hypothetical protein